MGSWSYHAFQPTLEEILQVYREDFQGKGPFEVWEIDPPVYGNHYVIIQRGRFRGRTPKLGLKRKIAP